jgi:branched-chain amino acid transport system permease protein
MAPQNSWLARSRTSARSGRGSLLLPRAVTLIVVGAVAPDIIYYFKGSYGNYVFQLSTAYALAVLGSNILVGYLGEATLAQGVFMAIGAYLCGSFVQHGYPFLLGLLVAVAVAALIGILLGNAVFRLRGAYAALATFSLAFALPDLIPHLSAITGGANGITLNSPVQVFNVQLIGDSEQLSYTLSAVFVIIALIVMYLLHGRPGRTLLAVAESRPAAAAFRTRSRRVVVWAWIAAGVLGALGGAVIVPVVGTVSPDQFTIYISLYVFVGTVAGGSRSALGAWVGGFLAGGLPILLASLPGGSDVLVFGLVLFAVVLVGPAGLLPGLEQGCVAAWDVVRRRLKASSPKAIGQRPGNEMPGDTP